jgi:hypothetical protein
MFQTTIAVRRTVVFWMLFAAFLPVFFARLLASSVLSPLHPD